MITGSIKTYDEPTKYKSHQWFDSEDYQGFDFTGYRHMTPSYAEQPGILEEAVKTGTMLGFVVDARVKRRNGIDNLGTIVKIHNVFSQAWNYTTGELEPFKVLWDSKVGSAGSAFDYSIADLDLVDVSVTPQKEQFNEGLSHLYQSC